MIKRRLYLQIYATIFASLLAVVVVSAVLWSIFGRNAIEFDGEDLNKKLAWLLLPPIGAPVTEQQATLNRVGKELGIDLTLFDPNLKVIANYGKRVAPPPRPEGREGWQRRHRNATWVAQFPDGRWLAANLGRMGPRRPFIAVLIYLGLISGAVLLVAYPLVRRLTRRLETLNLGVEQMGNGDLTARVNVGGNDEVAALAKNFNQAAGQIERLMGANKMLLANASHELRTPLARIRLGVELLKKKKSTQRQQELEQDISELDGLIDEILLMSRLDAKQQAVVPGTIDLLGLVAEECARYESVQLNGEPVDIVGDQRLIRRMVRNLLDNATKHGRPPVSVTLAKIENVIELTVLDEGDGIKTPDLEKIFEPFFRASTKQNVAGFGLGLALVKQIASAHNATVEVASDIGQGTKFVVRFNR